MKSKLEKFIPHKDQEEVLFQAFVSKDIMDEVKTLKEVQKLTWKELVEGLFNFYLEEFKKKDSQR